MTDELLIVRCRLGERAAFAELVRAWHDPVWNYVRRMLGPDRAEDVVQEVWLAVFRGLPKLNDPARFAPWLFTIARRQVTDLLRASYRLPEPEAPVEDTADLIVDRAVLGELLAAVPVREREVLILFYLQDLTLQTCAEICAVPVGTIKSRLNRGRRLLREEVARKGFTR
ncbi:RNA polymerase sigma-70 factor (ECF subfamily) [Actinoplanes tereljensis]|uniref:RNA polymerase sigma24 factor n=1 Tax=Paractinoplanes tereljensis TaxID=571912 RepID=A0A919NVI0_9ACTN|nr:sigma-70 family RNA polymerase sigma factor [Actinoplanes tereljensis]GIF25493.1 RNA polymerase sigma24 factor [Actinoplanes tereljensis]